MMPTGYTDALVRKKMTFPEFAMYCARGMGACIMMRDDPMDTPIPERFEPSSYHKEALDEAKIELERLSGMPIADRMQWGKQKLAGLIKSLEETIAKIEKDNPVRVYLAMLGDVCRWNPPTSDHEGLKKFMIQQLEESIKFDAPGNYWQEELAKVKSKDALTFYRDSVASAENDVAYHDKKWKEEVQRTEERNQWLKDLRESLR
jgi:hypothetical protein